MGIHHYPSDRLRVSPTLVITFHSQLYTPNTKQGICTPGTTEDVSFLGKFQKLDHAISMKSSLESSHIYTKNRMK